MLNDLTTGVTTISPEQLDALFQETPETTATADDLSLGKRESSEGLDQISLEDLDKLEKEPETPAKEEDKEKVEIPDPKKAAEEKKEEKKEEKAEEKPAEEEKKETEEEAVARKEFLKANVDYLVSKGLFKDFDGREEMEFTEEDYAELLEAQVKAAVEEAYTSKKKASGDYGEAIIDFIEKGGDPDLIIDLFKEQKAIQQVDISTEDAQKELITKYYKEVAGLKPSQVKKIVEGFALEDGELEREALEIKSKYDEAYKHQVDQLRDQQARLEQQQVERRKSFENNISKVITEGNYDDNRKSLLKNSLLKFKKLEDGSEVNEFYLKFAEWQSDPKKYVELAEFILDYDNYIKKREIEANNKAVEKTFKFVKGNAAVSRKTGTTHIDPEKQEDSFSFSFKK